MFKRSKSKVLVDETSEEDDVSWHHERARKDEESERTEDVPSLPVKDSKLKKVRSRRDRGDKKLFPSQDDEHILLTGVTVSQRRGSAKKSQEDKPIRAERDRTQCLWNSLSTTMKHITPARKTDRMEGWEPPQLEDESLAFPPGSEEDLSRYASLNGSNAGRPAQWAARARDKLTAVRRRSPATLSESSWEGLK